jgi:hypothetical protein
MLKLRLTLAFGLLAYCGGCTKKEPAVQEPQAASPSASLPTANPPPRLDASVAEAPAPPSRLKPLAGGNPMRITKLNVAPVEITVPPGFKLRMEGGVELAPTAYLEGPNLKVSINEPEGGFFSLKDEMKMFRRSYPDATSIRSDETEEGYLLVDRLTYAGQVRYTAYVARPKLRVECGASDLDTLEQAEVAASICLTLRPALGKTNRR